MTTTEANGPGVSMDLPTEGDSITPPPERRGVLDIPTKVVSRIARHSVFLHAKCTDKPDIDVLESSVGQIDLRVSLAIPYPEEPLGPMLNRLRRDVASDLAFQTGRRVGRLDLRVDRFVARPSAPRVL